MDLKSLKYITVFSLPVLAYISFTSYGWVTYLPIIEAFLIIPLLELVIKPDTKNVPESKEKKLSELFIYDLMVYAVVPVHIGLLVMFLFSMEEVGLTVTDKIGRITSMGLMCGVFGINVAHELGHRSKWYEQLMSKGLLLTSLYMHFFIEHNRGHHKNVSTQEDPSSARYGESLYRFWFRSVLYAYLSAWKLEKARLNKKNQSFVSINNEMIVFQILQVSLILSIWYFFGIEITAYFLLAAMMGFLQLETVNYIEHYGLERKKTGKGHYERVMPHHSWNSDHVVGRIMLFELSRHSDHHYLASRKYQILRHMEHSPQMPTGYPGMMILALIPPAWFKIMHKRIKDWNYMNSM